MTGLRWLITLPLFLNFCSNLYAMDLDPIAARAQHPQYDHPTEFGPKELWAKGDPATPEDLEDIEEWDDEWWGHGSSSNCLYDYMIFKFVAPAAYLTGTCTWRIVSADGMDVFIWHWSNTSGWEYISHDDENGEFYFPASYFGSEEGTAIILATSVTPNGNWIKCDVMKIEH